MEADIDFRQFELHSKALVSFDAIETCGKTEVARMSKWKICESIAMAIADRFNPDEHYLYGTRGTEYRLDLVVMKREDLETLLHNSFHNGMCKQNGDMKDMWSKKNG